MHLSVDDTIAAVASAPGGAYRGVVRISGPAVVDCLRPLYACDTGRALDDITVATALTGRLSLPSPLGVVACDLYVWPTRRSYTRQPAAEIHLPGSPALLDAALQAVCTAGARPAEPGEFTLRAFLAGRIDLTRAEAVLGVIDARQQHNLDVALEQLAGGLATPLGRLRDSLIELLAHLEAGLDFVEEDIEFITAGELQRQLEEAVSAVDEVAGQLSARDEATAEATVVLVGWPNVGKSSLLNALAGDAAAIVSHAAGTTRDYVTRRVEINGRVCLLTDTAGVEPAAQDEIGTAAQQAQARQVEQSQLRLLCLDSTRPLNRWECEQLAKDPLTGRLLVLTKTDAPREAEVSLPAIATSSHTGAGLDRLRHEIATALEATVSIEAGAVAGTCVRCRDSVRLAHECLTRARDLAATGAGEELVASEIRLALCELGKVVGAVYTDDVLDRVFSRFCIGK